MVGPDDSRGGARRHEQRPTGTEASSGMEAGLFEMCDDELGGTVELNIVPFFDVLALHMVEQLVDVGEEVELYSHRARLVRAQDKDWKERGLGDAKLLMKCSDSSTPREIDDGCLQFARLGSCSIQRTEAVPTATELG